MLQSTWTVFRRRPVEVTAVLLVVLVLRGLHVVATACPDSGDHDSPVQTCVEDLMLDVEARRTIDTLRGHYDDYPIHCRYGQYVCIPLCRVATSLYDVPSPYMTQCYACLFHTTHVSKSSADAEIAQHASRWTTLLLPKCKTPTFQIPAHWSSSVEFGVTRSVGLALWYSDLISINKVSPHQIRLVGRLGWLKSSDHLRM